MKQELKVKGMTCDHCKNAVSEELSALDGVSDVSVQLEPEGDSSVTIETIDIVDKETIQGALSNAGDYTLT